MLQASWASVVNTYQLSALQATENYKGSAEVMNAGTWPWNTDQKSFYLMDTYCNSRMRNTFS